MKVWIEWREDGLFLRDSSMVEQIPVKDKVPGSSPSHAEFCEVGHE